MHSLTQLLRIAESVPMLCPCPTYFIGLTCFPVCRTNVKHLVECFCEIVTPENSSQKPWVIQKFPDSFRDEDMLKQVSLFAFPCKTAWYGA